MLSSVNPYDDLLDGGSITTRCAAHTVNSCETAIIVYISRLFVYTLGHSPRNPYELIVAGIKTEGSSVIAVRATVRRPHSHGPTTAILLRGQSAISLLSLGKSALRTIVEAHICPHRFPSAQNA